VELAGQDLGTGILQIFLLPFEVGITLIEDGLTSTQDLELTTEGDVVQLFPLLQLPLSLLQLPPSSSTSCARWLTRRACTARSSSYLMATLARASADAYSSCASARAHLELATHWVMASNYRSKPRYRARAAAHSATVVLLSMLAHNWRRRRSLTRSLPLRALHLS
jgi:hypothetical protein